MSPSRNPSPRPPTAVRASSRSAYNSRAPSRPRASRNSSRASIAYLPYGAESALLPEAPLGEEAAELLQDLIHPHRNREHILLEESEDEDAEASDAESVEQRKKLPWYKRPSPVWFLVMIPITASATAATMAPRVEIYTMLACRALQPDYSSDNGTLPGLYDVSDGDRQRLCAADPAVQAAVAQMNMAMAAVLGVLTCLTTAWWGALSDRSGRIRVLSFALFGLLMTDVNFLVVFRFHNVLPGGYWFLIVGPFLDGLLGGMSTVTAAIHAYVADCTGPDERSHIFSLFLGLLFTGFGLGPTLGALIIHFTGSVLSVFYLAAGTHLLYAALVILFVPESLSKRRMSAARKVHHEQLAEARLGPRRHLAARWLQALFGFLRPLHVLAPVRVDKKLAAPGARHGGRDWNLLFVTMAYGCTCTTLGSYPYKFQYTSARFGWSSEQIGYWLSIVGITRAAYLTLVLPFVIRLVKRFVSKPAVQLPVSPNEPLQPAEPPRAAPSRSISFDFALARISLAVEVLTYAAIPFAPSALWFTAATMVGAFGTGFGPAIQSVALSLYTLRGGTESGKLFGAMSVVQSLCSQVVGPGVYGFTYMSTVRTHPATIFFVTCASIVLAFVFLALVRIPCAPRGDAEDASGLYSAAEGAQEEADEEEVPTIVVEDAGKATSPSASPSL